MRLLLIGRPASGKGTIAKLLEPVLNIPVLDIGTTLRTLPDTTPEAKEIKHYVNQGLLAPESLVGTILHNKTSEPLYSNGFILDGWCRQLEDLKFFDPKPDVVLYLDISEASAKERILNRRVCEKNGHPFNLVRTPPKKANICDYDGSPLVTRADDTIEVLQRRFDIFNSETLKSIDYFEKLGILIRINAEGSATEVFERVHTALSPYISRKNS